MVQIHQNERTIINALFDQGVFTNGTTAKMAQRQIDAANASKKPLTQQRISSFLQELLGVTPTQYQGNFACLFGGEGLAPEVVHVLLATLKAVINLPELQNSFEDRAVPTRTIIRQVHSEVVELSEWQIRGVITQLFVDQMGLLIAGVPEMADSASSDPQEVDDYWIVDVNFNQVAQCLVDRLVTPPAPAKLSLGQQVNQTLLLRQFISPQTSPELWPFLREHQAEIAAQWAQLGRFGLEMGQDYALLLDRQRQPSVAQPFILAIAVAQSLGAGIPVAALSPRINAVAAQVLPRYQGGTTPVKQALLSNGLVQEHAGFVVPTVLANRFAVTEQSVSQPG
ncbi:DUF4194 domain-containing protein [Lapidilactobacillus luobeiensis]|uniref:DUF4194 domain-containing protein n=1 Tax=Lapidilactobacillus luobeiensis TaxID=2950371 RepID=UPI0021C39CCC|nr:DUF4194 domain-containing protein [Lapidilactobacillus luobeiensis]